MIKVYAETTSGEIYEIRNQGTSKVPMNVDIYYENVEEYNKRWKNGTGGSSYYMNYGEMDQIHSLKVRKLWAEEYDDEILYRN